jgi:hypothetical protein
MNFQLFQLYGELYKPITGTEVSRRFKLPDFKIIGTRCLSVLCTGLIYPPEYIPDNIYFRDLVDIRIIVPPEGFCQ